MITDFLVEALQERTTVQVPNLGTFTSQPVSASIDEDTNIINPPSFEIVFIDDVTYGDSDDSIIKFISNKTDKSEQEVTQEIESLSEEIKTAVNNDQNYRLEGIGTFEKGLYGNIVFKNDAEGYVGNSYGLPKLTLEPLTTDELATDNQEEVVDEGNKFPEATLWGILIPSILIVLVAVWLMIDEGAREKATSFISGGEAAQVDETINNEGNTSANEPQSTKNEANQDDKEENSQSNEAENAVANKDTQDKTTTNDADNRKEEEETPKKVEEVASAPTLISSRTGRYYLSIASYPNEASAMARREKLVKQGYANAKVVEAGANKFRVSLADYDNRAEANKKVADSKGDYNSIWVFKY